MNSNKIRRNKQTRFLTLMTVLILGCRALLSAENASAGLAPKPPMGWNSYDSYGVYISGDQALANLEAMAEKLKPYGYEYFVLDAGWSVEYPLIPGTQFTAVKHATAVNLDKFGRNLPSHVYFPKGFEPITKRVKELGLKFGVHMMRGIPKQAVEQNLPIKGTPYHARDIANTDPKANCPWCPVNYAVDMTKPGAQEYYDSLLQHLADMGVDFIKYDDIVPHPDEVNAVTKALKKTGRPILLSLSPGGNVDPNALNTFMNANMLRVTHDIWDDEKGINQCFEAWRKWTGKERPGFWIDMDMIPFGKLATMNPTPLQGGANGDVRHSGKGYIRWSALSADQMRTFITMRALSASPLMVGGDLPTLDPFSMQLLTNADMLACNQNGVMGHLIYEKDGVEIWSTPEQGSNGKKGWIGVFNRNWQDAQLTLTPDLLKVDVNSNLIRDIWNGSRVWKLKGKEKLPVSVPASGVLFLRFDLDKASTKE